MVSLGSWLRGVTQSPELIAQAPELMTQAPELITGTAADYPVTRAAGHPPVPPAHP